MSRARIFAGCLAMVGAMLASPTTAYANPAEQIGFGTIGVGMGNAMVAGDDVLSAPVYNPAAGVLGSDRYQLGFGYTFSHIAVDVNGQDPNVVPVRGFWFGAGIPFRLGRLPLSFGFAFYAPDQFLIRAHSVPASEARLVMWDNRPHRLIANATLSARICDWLAIGVGATLLGSVNARQVDFLLDADPARTRAESALIVDFPILIAPIVGVTVSPIEGLRLGARFTDELKMDIVLNVVATVSVPGTPVNGDVLISFRGPSGFTPRELTFGGSYDHLTESGDRWRFSAELGWQQWSRVNQLTSLVSVDADLGMGVDFPATAFLEPNPNLRNTWNPRFGIEYRHATSNTTALRLRAGYFFTLTPTPPQTGTTNFADSNRHTGTLGGSYDFEAFDLPVGVDLAFQLHYMVQRDIEKADASEPNGDLTVGGAIYSLSLGFRVEI